MPGGRSDGDVVHGEWDGAMFIQDVFSADEKQFSLVCVQFEKVVRLPVFDLWDAVFSVGEWGLVSGFDAEVDLSVINVIVKDQGEFPTDMSKGRQVTNEEQGAKDWALRGPPAWQGRGWR